MNSEKWQQHLKHLTGDYANEFEHRDLEDNHLGITLAFLKENVDTHFKKVLDLGCGPGIIKLSDTIVTGLDVYYRGSDIVHGDAHDIPFEDEYFDVVFCSHTLEHVLSPLICLSEIFRVLKKDGVGVIGVPLFPHFLGRDHNYVLSEGSWLHLCKQAKLKVITSSIQTHCLSLLVRRKE